MATTEPADLDVTASMAFLPKRSTLVAFAILLPAAVAGSNQLFFNLIPSYPSLRGWLYPWLAFTTAVLSWSTGRYLQPAFLRWTVFAWCLALLDLLTIAACVSGPVERHFGYVLVSTQIGLIVLWAILGAVNWQWRMPVVLAALAGVIVLAGGLNSGGRRESWPLLMVLETTVILLLCGLMRLSGFVLESPGRHIGSSNELAALKIHQFGLKHMLIWATAFVPILLVMRGLDFFFLERLGGPDLFSLVLVAAIIAIVNLIAIWSVLGDGHWFLRLAALLVIPLILAAGMSQYLEYVESIYRINRGLGQASGWLFNRAWYNSLVRGIADERDSLVSWLWLDAALLAALLLFLRASGYRLARKGT